MCNAFLCYLSQGTEAGCPPIHWTKLVDDVGSMEHPFYTDNDMVSFSSESLADKIGMLLQEQVMPEMENGLTAYVAVGVSGNGSSSCSVVSAPMLQSIDDFSFESLDGLVDGLSDLELSAIHLARETELNVLHHSIEEVKKNAIRRPSQDQD